MSDPYLLQFLAHTLNLRGQPSRTARRFRVMLVVVASLLALAITAGVALMLLSHLAR